MSENIPPGGFFDTIQILHLASSLAQQQAVTVTAGPALVAAIDSLAQTRARLDALDRHARNIQIVENLDYVTTHLLRLQHNDYPTLGPDFMRAATGLGCTVLVEPDLDCLAHYTSFSLHAEDPGFVNRLTFGLQAAQDLRGLFNAYTHELRHGLQKLAAPALRASPFNPDSKIIVCPRDWLLLEERCEQDAYTFQGWLSWLALADDPDLYDTGANTPMSARRFAETMARTGNDTAAAFRIAAAECLGISYYLDNPHHPYRFVHHTHDHALRSYRNAISTRLNNGETDLVFVRLAPHHVYQIGACTTVNGVGPSTFGNDPDDPAHITATPFQTIASDPDELSTADRLALLNARLGITDEMHLPILDETALPPLRPGLTLP